MSLHFMTQQTLTRKHRDTTAKSVRATMFEVQYFAIIYINMSVGNCRTRVMTL